GPSGTIPAGRPGDPAALSVRVPAEPARRLWARAALEAAERKACFFTRTACVPGRPWASSLRGALPVYAAIPTVPGLLRALPYLADHAGRVRPSIARTRLNGRVRPLAWCPRCCQRSLLPKIIAHAVDHSLSQGFPVVE